jgi:hypothetical protein
LQGEQKAQAHARDKVDLCEVNGEGAHVVKLRREPLVNLRGRIDVKMPQNPKRCVAAVTLQFVSHAGSSAHRVIALVLSH